MASYEVIINQHEEEWVVRCDWPEHAWTITISVVKIDYRRMTAE